MTEAERLRIMTALPDRLAMLEPPTEAPVS